MSFDARMGPARRWELRLIELLRERGWLAAQYGQAMIPEEIRNVLRGWTNDRGPTLIRWSPDIIAGTAVPFRFCLVDAKSETRKTDNYSLEIKAVDADLVHAHELNAPVYYVWEDGGVLTPDMVVEHQHWRSDGTGSKGSGTPFYLIKKSFAESFDDVFPDVRGDA